MFVAESFNSDVIKIMENIHFPQMVAKGIHNPKFLHVDYHIHSSLEKSLIEGLSSESKIELSFHDYFPCTVKNCKLEHVQNWLNLFVNYYNQEVIHA